MKARELETKATTMTTTQTTQTSALTPDALLRQLRWRYATKRFDPVHKIPAETWNALEEALRLSPSSFGLQPWRFIVVTDPAVKKELTAVSWNQSQIVECSHLVVFAIQKDLGPAAVEKLIASIVKTRGVTRESLAGYEKVMLGFLARPKTEFDVDNWSRRQLYLALGNFLTSAALLGVDACPMEGIDPAGYDRVLGLSARGLGAVVVAAAGQRSPSDPYARAAKVRFAAEDVITHIG